MNCRLPLASIAAMLGSLAAAEEPSLLRFANPSLDQLSGSLESLAGDQVVWNAPILTQPTPFWLKNVLEMTLPAATPELEVSHEASLRLMNGDVVRGQLASVTDEVITLDTWYAGRLEFRRVMVKQVDVEDRASLIYRGPTGLDGWVQTAKPPTWSYESGALRTSASRGIGRELGLPDECRIAFELAWRGSLMMNLNLFTDTLTSDSPARGYQIGCQGGYVSIRRLGAMMQGGDVASVPEFKENEKVRVEVRASKVSGNISIYVNDRLAANWKDTEVKGKLGTALQFVPQGNMESVRIAKIKVSTWDGVMEEAPDENAAMLGMGMGGIRRFGMGNLNVPEPKPEPKPKPVDEGRMKLRNGDSIGGTLQRRFNGIN